MRTNDDPVYLEGLLAAGLMYQGYLNSLHHQEDQCQQLALCEARVHVSRMGGVARVLGRLAEIHGYKLLDLDHEEHDVDGDTTECGQRFICRRSRRRYKYPDIEKL